MSSSLAASATATTICWVPSPAAGRTRRRPPPQTEAAVVRRRPALLPAPSPLSTTRTGRCRGRGRYEGSSRPDVQAAAEAAATSSTSSSSSSLEELRRRFQLEKVRIGEARGTEGAVVVIKLLAADDGEVRIALEQGRAPRITSLKSRLYYGVVEELLSVYLNPRDGRIEGGIELSCAAASPAREQQQQHWHILSADGNEHIAQVVFECEVGAFAYTYGLTLRAGKLVCSLSCRHTAAALPVDAAEDLPTMRVRPHWRVSHAMSVYVQGLRGLRYRDDATGRLATNTRARDALVPAPGIQRTYLAHAENNDTTTTTTTTTNNNTSTVVLSDEGRRMSLILQSTFGEVLLHSRSRDGDDGFDEAVPPTVCLGASASSAFAPLRVGAGETWQAEFRVQLDE
eukprot:jgi/Chlat1/8494/Chrsp80S07933